MNLINIIHPYTYKQQEDEIIVGIIKENKERDKKVNDFLKKALDTNNQVIWHQYKHQNIFEEIIIDKLLRIEFNVLYDPRIERFRTLSDGTPIPDKKNDVKEDIWEKIKRVYLTKNFLKEKAEKAKNTFFIGGMLECCVLSSASYYYHYVKDKNLFYIPELCVKYKEETFERREHEFKERNIKPISYKEAMKILEE